MSKIPDSLVSLSLADIHLRDPFILAVPEDGSYYLYGTNGPNPWDNSMGFDAYMSKDLVEWIGPMPVFRSPDDFWADRSFWAPEVFAHHGRFYMCASFTKSHWGHRRGTQILVADSPLGPFIPHSDGPVTPEGDVCIDGTLFWDDLQQPWMVYCHERMQVTDGLMCATQLTQDLRVAVGDHHNLFRASEAPWAHVIDGDQFTTDGPFMLRLKSGVLAMIWSSFHYGTYALGVAYSPSGNLLGPWNHEEKPLFLDDGGHGMVFQDFQGNSTLVLHTPGMVAGRERPALFRLCEEVEVGTHVISLQPYAPR
jgi:arabinan endo-1,5-alpha-L-arabinosidase